MVVYLYQISAQIYDMKKQKVKYNYDYPENRAISNDLTTKDMRLIAERSGYSYSTVRKWCEGKRRNKTIERLAILIQTSNKATRSLVASVKIKHN